MVLLIGAVYLKQRVRAKHLVSLGLSYGGIVLVFRNEAAIEGPLDTIFLGAALVFASAVSYAVYLIAGAVLVLAGVVIMSFRPQTARA